jgi:hypothetical protein
MNFKRHISFLTALLVLVSNSGLAFSVHYCGGKIASVSSVFSKEEICNMPVMAEKTCCAKPEADNNDCCSDKKINLKSKSEKIIIKTISLDFETVYFLDYKPQLFAEAKIQHSTNKNVAFYCESNAPPLYKLYCQYTFYA